VRAILRLLLLGAGAVSASVSADDAPAITAAIKLDQAGYLLQAPKLAMVVAENRQRIFYLRRESDSEYVYANWLSDAQPDANSGDDVQIADFSDFAESGRFFVDIPEVGRSYAFQLGAETFRRPYYLAMRSFYGQRCGIAVDLGPEFPGYHYAACHTTGAYHDSSGKSGPRASAYGWHDAGDYGRYVVNSGITTGTLLMTHELFGPRLAGTSLNIPESGNGTPDLLNEIRWNLEWMLTMQDPDDGGVWHKQTSPAFAAFVMPDKDPTVSQVIGTPRSPYKSSCASADFAAVMAMAQRAYARYDSAFAERAGLAAARAWDWLELNPYVTFNNPQGVSTGEYGDGDCSDERLWAAAELWRTTGNDAYHSHFLANYERFVDSASTPSWPHMAPMALWTYALSGRENIDATARDLIGARVSQVANELVDRIAANPYRTAMTSGDFIWGSNAQAANYSMLLLVANALAPDPRFANASLENLHYLLGRNPFSVSWVTAVGTEWFKKPHHRPSVADGIQEPWPGLLAGGPNKDRNDNILLNLPASLAPMKIWSDHPDSYSGNENAINWNAPLVFILAGALPEPPKPEPPAAAKPGI